MSSSLDDELGRQIRQMARDLNLAAMRDVDGRWRFSNLATGGRVAEQTMSDRVALTWLSELVYG